jgi:hypothetical protein
MSEAGGRGRLARWRQARRGGAERRTEIRAVILEALHRNPIAGMADPGAYERLMAGEDVSFDELGLDSLALLTVADDLDGAGFPVSGHDVDEAGSIDQLTRLLLRRG